MTEFQRGMILLAVTFCAELVILMLVVADAVHEKKNKKSKRKNRNKNNIEKQ